MLALPELETGMGGPFSVKLLPGDVSTAYLHDAETGAFLGPLRHVPAARYGDEADQMRAVGEVQHMRSLIVQPVMERHADERAEMEARQRLNAALIASARTGAECPNLCHFGGLAAPIVPNRPRRSIDPAPGPSALVDQADSGSFRPVQR